MRLLVLVCFCLASWGGTWVKGSALEQCSSNTTLRMPSSLPQFGFTTSNAFEGLTFNYPVAIDFPPGETNRLFVAEKTGRVMVITNLASPTTSVFLNLTN